MLKKILENGFKWNKSVGVTPFNKARLCPTIDFFDWGVHGHYSSEEDRFLKKIKLK